MKTYLKSKIGTCFGVSFAAILLTAQIASAQTLFGAIAFSQNDGAEGTSWDYSSRSQAESRAYSECVGAGGRDCQIVTWFRNACGALAVGDGNGWGSHWGEDRWIAEENALRACRSQNRGCRIVRWTCVSGYQP